MTSSLDAIASMSDDVLESEIRGLSARVAAAMCRFLMAVAEYDRRRAWERWECRDMVAWLAWKCGISPVTAREYCRVAQGLQRFSLVRERFSLGALSYTQVRAICRAATPATEEMMVDLAAVSTGAQLERITRAFRRTATAAADEEKSRDAGRFLRFSYDEEGCLVGSFRLPAETGAVLAGAVERAVEVDAVKEADADGARDPYLAVQADALVALVAAGAAATNSEGADDDSRYLVTVIAERAVLDGTESDHEPGECHIDDGPGLSADTARRIACDATVTEITETPDGTILDVGRRTRVIGRRMRRALRRRDAHCRYPGCTRRIVEAHHIRHWIEGGPTTLTNLVSLCARHHHRLHEGGYTIRRTGAGQIEFVHPHGWTIPEVCPPPEQLQSRIGWDEPAPYEDGWDGTPLDLVTVIEGLHYADQDSNRARSGPDTCSDSAASPSGPLQGPICPSRG